jgi:curved DNA-binding protein
VNMTNPWTVLGLDQAASADEIKAAYRRLAKDHHPDRGGDPDRFMQIQNAYQQLTNPEKNQSHNAGPHPNFNDYDLFKDIFERIQFDQFGFGARPGNPNFETTIWITVQENIQGCTKTIELTDNGKTRTINITIPPGSQTGDTVKYGGQGSTARADLPPGDLYVRIRVQPHDNFELQNGDLCSERTLSVVDAWAGCSLTVTDPYGSKLEIRVPDACQPGTILRVKGQGGLNRTKQQRGDMLIKIQIQLPKLTDAQKEQLRGILD